MLQTAEYEREDYQTLALLEVRILSDSVSGQAGELSGYGSRCRCRWLARPPHSRGVRGSGSYCRSRSFRPRLWRCGCGALACCAVGWMWGERVEQDLVVVGEAGGGPESFEDVGR
jgi:hypothetical protein